MLKALLYGKTPQIVRCGHPVLRHVCEPVSDFKNQQLHAVVAEMKAVFANKLTPVVGLAAPQIGHSLQLIAFRVNDKLEPETQQHQLTFVANPRIIPVTGTTLIKDYEFCESVPGYSALVSRYNKVLLRGQNLGGDHVEFKFDGLLARIVQHEVDHVNARLFTDVMDKESLRADQYVGKFEVVH